MTFQELEQTVKEYVANDKLPEAITLLSAYFKEEPAIDSIILQSGRYHSLKNDQVNGTVDYNTLQIAFNQLRSNILQFLQQHQPTTTTITSINENKSIGEKMSLSHARISILWLLKDSPPTENGFSIRQIQESTTIPNRKFIVQALQEMTTDGLVARNRVNKNTFWCLTDQGVSFAEKLKTSSDFKE